MAGEGSEPAWWTGAAGDPSRDAGVLVGDVRPTATGGEEFTGAVPPVAEATGASAGTGSVEPPGPDGAGQPVVGVDGLSGGSADDLV